ncbi:AraC family transcriptional regulator [Litorivivens sp.]|uniref:AraC family transcriptional regulator n=2 Tax=Litorivivens sp. TaxID=2020868 RepID=UPI00356A3B3E
MNSRTISICFVRSMLSHCPEHQRAELFRRAGLAPDIIQQDKARISPAQFAQLSRSAMKVSGDEACGHYPGKLKLGTYRLLAQFVSEAKDLRSAIARNIQFIDILETGYQPHFKEAGRNAHYQIQPEAGCTVSPWVVEQHLMLTHRFMSWLVGTPIPLSYVGCHYPAPPHRDEYHFLFFSPMRFEQAQSELVFESRLLDLPVVKSHDDLEALVRQMPYNLLFMPSHQKNYTDQIRRYIRKSLPNSPSYEQISESLGLTPQTLRRRLRDEGCDFRQIRNELLRDMAIDLLQQSDASVQEISYQLGFSEPSAFIRSFRNWTGVPPNHYRRQEAAQFKADSVQSL